MKRAKKLDPTLLIARRYAAMAYSHFPSLGIDIANGCADNEPIVRALVKLLNDLSVAPAETT